MRNLPGALALALLFIVSAQAAEPAPATETLYVRAQPVVALRSTPADTAVTVRQLAPGDALTVLGRQAGFVNVQAADGVQGWLRETDLTAAAPPAARVAELEAQAVRLREELASAEEAARAAQGQLRRARQAASAARESGEDQSAALEADNRALQERLVVASAEISRLQQRVTELETAQQMAREAAELLAARKPPAASGVAARFSRADLAIAGTAGLGLALLGAWLGAASAHRRMRRRYHGLEL